MGFFTKLPKNRQIILFRHNDHAFNPRILDAEFLRHPQAPFLPTPRPFISTFHFLPLTISILLISP